MFRVCTGNESTWNREINALIEVMNILEVKSGNIVSYDREENLKIDQHNIKIIPSYNWLMGHT
jgi:predicted AAA+ superfamily ATPase